MQTDKAVSPKLVLIQLLLNRAGKVWQALVCGQSLFVSLNRYVCVRVGSTVIQNINKLLKDAHLKECSTY